MVENYFNCLYYVHPRPCVCATVRASVYTVLADLNFVVVIRFHAVGGGSNRLIFSYLFFAVERALSNNCQRDERLVNVEQSSE